MILSKSNCIASFFSATSMDISLVSLSCSLSISSNTSFWCSNSSLLSLYLPFHWFKCLNVSAMIAQPLWMYKLVFWLYSMQQILNQQTWRKHLVTLSIFLQTQSGCSFWIIMKHSALPPSMWFHDVWVLGLWYHFAYLCCGNDKLPKRDYKHLLEDFLRPFDPFHSLHCTHFSILLILTLEFCLLYGTRLFRFDCEVPQIAWLKVSTFMKSLVWHHNIL